MSKSKNDLAWELLFDKHKFVEELKCHGEFIIHSKDINKFRESRLMTKFDSKKDLPTIFKKYGLSILPISRGSYKVGKFNIFHDFEDYDSPRRTDLIYEMPFPSFIETIDANAINSETTAIACADLCSIIKDFTGERELYSTIGGRMGTGSFEFSIAGDEKVFDFQVAAAQIEIDAGFEGYNGIYLIEAKNILSTDFIVRQVYYPYRTWLNKDLHKNIKNIYLTYSNGVFYLREYEFKDPYNPNSITLQKSSRYSIISKELTISYLENLININLPQLDSRGAPFPQADDFNRVVNLCEQLKDSNSINLIDDDEQCDDGGLYKDEIADIYDFTLRQADYYSNAARYLGLVTIYRGYVTLTDLGSEILQMPLTKRQIKFVELILSSEPFVKVMSAYLEKSGTVSISLVQEIVKTCEIGNLNLESDTFPRRCLTVKCWVEWILTQVKES